MTAKEETPQFDFGDRTQFNRLASSLTVKHRDALRAIEEGRDTHVYRVEVVRCRDARTASQNAYYWAVVLPYAAKGMRDAFGEDVDTYDAHEFFKERLLRRPIVNKTDRAIVDQATGRTIGSGEILGYATPSTKDLDTAEMSHYINAIIAFCLDMLNVEVPQASRTWDDPQLPAPPAVGRVVDVGPGRFQIQPPPVDPDVRPGRKSLPPGVARGPAAEDGESEEDQDRRAERLAGTPEDFE